MKSFKNYYNLLIEERYTDIVNFKKILGSSENAIASEAILKKFLKKSPQEIEDFLNTYFKNPEKATSEHDLAVLSALAVSERTSPTLISSENESPIEIIILESKLNGLPPLCSRIKVAPLTLQTIFADGVAGVTGWDNTAK